MRKVGWPILALVLSSAACMNHYAVHPRTAPPSVRAWSEVVDRSPIRLHLEWAAPSGRSSLPTVVVHPEAGATSRDMRGVVFDLASHGYQAVAADYERLIDGRYRRTLFPFRALEDPLTILQVLGEDCRVDMDRLALMGFSQGAVFSLVMAALDPRPKAVVAYYPVTDFVRWLNEPPGDPLHRLVFWFIRRHFRSQSGATTDARFQWMLERASPLRQAGSITSPVLLVHGVNDRTAPVEESRRLAARLRELNRSVELLEIPGAGHVFNFYDREAVQGRLAWNAALAFLDAHLKPAHATR